jgi:TPR repeat protein
MRSCLLIFAFFTIFGCTKNNDVRNTLHIGKKQYENQYFVDALLTLKPIASKSGDAAYLLSKIFEKFAYEIAIKIEAGIIDWNDEVRRAELASYEDKKERYIKLAANLGHSFAICELAYKEENERVFVQTVPITNEYIAARAKLKREKNNSVIAKCKNNSLASNGQALTYLGKTYLENQDFVNALESFELALKNNNIDAAYELYMLYSSEFPKHFTRIKFPPDEKKALLYLMRCADENEECKILLAESYLYGKMGVEKNEILGLQLLNSVVEAGYKGWYAKRVRGVPELIKYYAHTNNGNEIFKQIIRLNAMDIHILNLSDFAGAAAKTDLYQFIDNIFGQVGKEDILSHIDADKCFESNVKNVFYYVYFYFKNSEKFDSLEKALNQHKNESEKSIKFNLIIKNVEFEKDEAAEEFYKKIQKSMYLLGVFNFIGFGEKENIQEGVKWLIRASNLRYKPAIVKLIDIYEKNDLLKDLEKAKIWKERLSNLKI